MFKEGVWRYLAITSLTRQNSLAPSQGGSIFKTHVFGFHVPVAEKSVWDPRTRLLDKDLNVPLLIMEPPEHRKIIETRRGPDNLVSVSYVLFLQPSHHRGLSHWMIHRSGLEEVTSVSPSQSSYIWLLRAPGSRDHCIMFIARQCCFGTFSK